MALNSKSTALKTDEYLGSLPYYHIAKENSETIAVCTATQEGGQPLEATGQRLQDRREPAPAHALRQEGGKRVATGNTWRTLTANIEVQQHE